MLLENIIGLVIKVVAISLLVAQAPDVAITSTVLALMPVISTQAKLIILLLMTSCAFALSPTFFTLGRLFLTELSAILITSKSAVASLLILVNLTLCLLSYNKISFPTVSLCAPSLKVVEVVGTIGAVLEGKVVVVNISPGTIFIFALFISNVPLIKSFLNCEITSEFILNGSTFRRGISNSLVVSIDFN